MTFRPDDWARDQRGVRGRADAGRRRPSAFVAAACAGAAALQEHVEKLLAAHQLANSFLETPAVLFDEGSMTIRPRRATDCGVRAHGAHRRGRYGRSLQSSRQEARAACRAEAAAAASHARSERLRRFRAEARAASSLNHPHILVVHDFGDFNGRPFIVTEFVEGQTLRERIDADPDRRTGRRRHHDPGGECAGRGACPRNRASRYQARKRDAAARRLREGAGLRPCAPGDERGIRDHDRMEPGTQPGTLVGTLRYMSPEQSRGQPVHAPSDVFSLGLVLFEMVTGRHPFHADSSIGVLHGIQSGTPAASGAGAELDDCSSRCFRRTPSLRPAAADVVARLTGFATRAPAVAYVSRHRTSVGRERERADLRTAFETADRGQSVSLSPSPVNPASGRARWSMTSSPRSPRQPGSDVAAVRSAWRAPRRTSRFSKRSTACSSAIRPSQR